MIKVVINGEWLEVWYINVETREMAMRSVRL
jgi:hypothetical protein